MSGKCLPSAAFFGSGPVRCIRSGFNACTGEVAHFFKLYQVACMHDLAAAAGWFPGGRL